MLADIQAKRIDVVVVYKVDRLTRSLADFAKIVEVFDASGVSFVSVKRAISASSFFVGRALPAMLSPCEPQNPSSWNSVGLTCGPIRA
jgi:site-specific DNA recombinase